MSTIVVERQRAALSPMRLAAWSMIVGAVLQMALGSPPVAVHQNPASPVFGLVATLNAASHLLLLVGIVGLARSGAVGGRRLATTGLTLTLGGLGLLIVAEVVWWSVGEAAAEPLYSTATLALALGPILAGVALVRAGRWTGWHRFTLLACGLYVPLVLLPSFALPGAAMNYAIGIWGVCWLLLGLAQRAEAALAAAR